jgi:hypothetical protein
MKIPFVRLGVGAAFALASVSPAVAVAGNGHGPSTAPGHTKVHNVTCVFKGTWNATAGTVTVKHGNSFVRKAHLVGTDVTFDLSSARIVVRDTNSDGSRNLTDVQDGDKVVVKARLPRKDPGSQPFKAKMLIDQTHPPTTGDSTP